MPIIKCIRDDEGYWMEDEEYVAAYAGGGRLSVGDNDDPKAEWIVTPISYEDDNSIVYRIGGLNGVVEFLEKNAN